MVVYVFTNIKRKCPARPSEKFQSNGAGLQGVAFVPSYRNAWSRLASNGAAGDHVGLFYMRARERSAGNPKCLN
jgi:hypothetical protein